LVMNPDRMVIVEAQRTFTYLNLYGYLTDAVIVNRVFPDDVDGYFGGWRERQQEHLRLVADGFAPVPVLTARYFDEEVIGDRMLDRLAGELFAEHPAEAVLYTELAHDVSSEDGRTVLRLRMPFAERGDVSLKKVGPELVVTVGHEKRTIILPSALARRRPSGARLEGGLLEVSFEDDRSPTAAPPHLRRDAARAPEPV
jgi:arsenite/tail-anchored protein-transporting ATPase